MASLRSCGVKVPDEIPVAGYDNDRVISETLCPPLTTVDLPGSAMAVRAAKRLMALITGVAVRTTRRACPTPNLCRSPGRSAGTVGYRTAQRHCHSIQICQGGPGMKHLHLMAGAAIATVLSGGAAMAQTDLSIWYHGAGNEVEIKSGRQRNQTRAGPPASPDYSASLRPNLQRAVRPGVIPP